ncbi:MAG: DUF1127 domain-containing protein [Pseudomonadota bacterium]
MTYFNDTRRSGGVSTVFARFVAGIREGLAYRRAYNATRAELDGLSARELDDLGISPAKIDEIAHSAAQEAVARR